MEFLVTAVVSSYNHARYLEEAVTSVLAQDLDVPYEVLVIDDGSTDGSRAILERLAKASPHMRVVFQANRGISGTFNRGLELARGTWVAYCGSDDRWHPNHLRTLVKAVEKRPGVLACFGCPRVIDAEGAPRYDTPMFKSPHRPNLLRHLLYNGNFICFTASLLRRESILDAGGFDVELGVLQDYDLWLRLLRHGGSTTATATQTMDFRWHGENASGAASGLQKRLDHVRILQRALREMPELAADARLRARVSERLVSAHRRIARRCAEWPERLHHLREARRHGGSLWQIGAELLRRPSAGPPRGIGMPQVSRREALGQP